MVLFIYYKVCSRETVSLEKAARYPCIEHTDESVSSEDDKYQKTPTQNLLHMQKKAEDDPLPPL